MLVSLVAILTVALGAGLIGSGGGGDNVFVSAVLLSNTALFILTFRRVYPGRLAVTIGKGFVFSFLTMVSIIYVFRPLLFLITNAST